MNRIQVKQYLSSLADEELEPFVKTSAGWCSVHSEETLFLVDAGTLAPTLSKAVGTVAVLFVLIDGVTLECSTWGKGREGEKARFVARRRTTLNVNSWQRAGLSSAALKRLGEPFVDVTEAAMLIARGLGIPTATVLVDDPALLEALDDPPGKRVNDPEVARAWAALQREANHVGVKVPGFQEFLELQGGMLDADEALGMIELLRAKFLG